MDGRKYNGAIKGKYQGQGRLPKIKEIELIERLTPLEDIALKALEKGVKSGEFAFIKLYFEYRYGKPKQQLDIQETQMLPPLIFVNKKEYEDWKTENNQ